MDFWLQRTFFVEEDASWKDAMGNLIPAFYYVCRFFAETRAEAEAILRDIHPLHGGVLRMREEEIVTTRL